MQEFRPNPLWPITEGDDKRPSLLRKMFEAQTEELLEEKLRASEEAEKDAGMRLEKELKFRKIGRNEACPCGSGKKFKFCHLSLL